MLKIRVTLGIIALFSSALSALVPINKGLLGLIVATLGLLALSMNFKYERGGKISENDEETKGVKISERNAWDIWFYSMPAVILTLFFVGVLADDVGVWKWVAISLGGAVGLESLSAIIKNSRS